MPAPDPPTAPPPIAMVAVPPPLTGYVMRALVMVLLACVFSEALLAGLSFRQAPQDWNLVNSVIDKLQQVATIVLGGILGNIVPAVVKQQEKP